MMFDIKLTEDGSLYDIGAVVEGGIIRWQWAHPSVAQRVQQALKLLQGTWFLDLRDGMPWYDIVRNGNKARLDSMVRRKVQSVAGVEGIERYSSVNDRGNVRIDIDIITSLGLERVTFTVER